MPPHNINTGEVDAAIKDINGTFGLRPYEAFDVAWIAVIKMANMLPGSTEHHRLVELGNRLSDDAIRHILQSEELDTLLNLKPPLETILSFPHSHMSVSMRSALQGNSNRFECIGIASPNWRSAI
jgi:hypothetical protein